MEIKLASKYGFCFGVKRAIEISEEHSGSITYGPLIHNPDEIKRLKENFQIDVAHSLDELANKEVVIIRTHGIPKDEFNFLKKQNKKIIDATCPYVTKPQLIVEQMCQEGYSVVIFGDKEHPEIKGVFSYASHHAFIVLDEKELSSLPLKGKVAVVSQTTKKPQDFLKIVNALILNHKEVRVFNTICNATFENQDAAAELAKESDIMIIIGGKHSSNTKQLHHIALSYCSHSYLIENKSELQSSWFEHKKICGISAGASTPEWIVDEIVESIRKITT